MKRFGPKAQRKAKACLEARKYYFEHHELEDSNGEALCQIGSERMRFEDSTADHRKKRHHGDDSLENFMIVCWKHHSELDRNPDRLDILKSNPDVNARNGGVLT